MVLQATAYGITKPGVSMQVAVKMLKGRTPHLPNRTVQSQLAQNLTKTVNNICTCFFNNYYENIFRKPWMLVQRMLAVDCHTNKHSPNVLGTWSVLG